MLLQSQAPQAPQGTAHRQCIGPWHFQSMDFNCCSHWSTQYHPCASTGPFHAGVFLCILCLSPPNPPPLLQARTRNTPNMHADPPATATPVSVPPTCCEAQHGLAAAEDELQHCDGWAQLPGRHVPCSTRSYLNMQVTLPCRGIQVHASFPSCTHTDHPQHTQVTPPPHPPCLSRAPAAKRSTGLLLLRKSSAYTSVTPPPKKTRVTPPPSKTPVSVPPTCCEAQHGLAAAEEELQHCDGWAQLPGCHVPQVADGTRCLKDHHLSLKGIHTGGGGGAAGAAVTYWACILRPNRQSDGVLRYLNNVTATVMS
jgi:hypothetical protein